MTDNIDFQSWSLQKVHDELLKLGYNNVAQSLRSHSLGLAWGVTGLQIAQLNGVVAAAKHCIDSGKVGPFGLPPDGQAPGGQVRHTPALVDDKEWDVVTGPARKVA